jgi:hypothetical protein
MRNALVIAALTALALGCQKQPPDKTPAAPAVDWSAAGSSPFADARVGDTVTFSTAAGEGTAIVTRLEVTAADESSITLRRSVSVNAAPGAAPDVSDQTVKRDYDPNGLVQVRATGQKRSPIALSVGQVQVVCDVYDVVASDAPAAKRYYLSPKVPGWLVRVDSGSPESLAATSWAVDFAR